MDAASSFFYITNPTCCTTLARFDFESRTTTHDRDWRAPARAQAGAGRCGGCDGLVHVAVGREDIWQKQLRVAGSGQHLLINRSKQQLIFILVQLVLTIFSPWQWFVSTRTFSNNLETALTAVALTYWPWQWMQSHSGKSNKVEFKYDGYQLFLRFDLMHPSLKYCFLAAGFATALRPTNILIWFILGVMTLPHLKQAELWTFIRNAHIFG